MAELTESSGATYPTPRRIENGEVQAGGATGLWNEHALAMIERTNNLKKRIDLLTTTASETVTVGDGGDYATINEALSYLSEHRPGHVRGGFNVNVTLLSGFVMAEQVLMKATNLGWVNIIAEDAETQIDRAYLTEQYGSCYPAFGVSDGGVLPVIDALFTMMATGTATDRVGVYAFNSSSARVLSGGGIKNCGGAGARLEASGVLSANSAIFSGCGGEALYASGGCRAAMQYADLSGSLYGINAINGANVHAYGANCSGAATTGVRAMQLSMVNARNVSAQKISGTDQTTDIIALEGGIIECTGSTGGTNLTPNTVTASGIIFK